MGDINDFIDNEENSLTLTLDINLQYKLQEELEKAVAMSESNAGAAILLDSSNGDILAVANFPTYNPCLLYTSPSPRDTEVSRMPSSA